MLSKWIEQLIQLGSEVGYLGVFLSSTGLVPSEIIIPATSASMPDKIIAISLFGALGQTTGAVITYTIGYFLGEKVVAKYISGKKKFLGISEDSYKESQKLIGKYGPVYIFISRFIPGARIISSLVAGFTKQRFFVFLISVITGSFVFGYIFSLLGRSLNSNLEVIKIWADTSYGVALFILIIIFFLLFKYRKEIKNYLKKKK